MRTFAPLLLSVALLITAGCPVSGPDELSPLAAPPSGATTATDTPHANLPESEESLESLVRRTLESNLSGRRLASDTHGAWQILHGVLAYGDRFTIDTPDGEQNAIEFLLGGGAVNGFEPVPGDPFGQPPRRGLKMEMQPSTKIGQGHRDQWLAVLAQTGLPAGTPLNAAGHSFTMEDWVRQTEFDVPRNLEGEFSWTLIALTSYRETSHVWTAADQQSYGIDNLLAVELDQDLSQSSCGGTHRLIGIAMALRQRRAEKAPLTGDWSRASAVLADAVALARQNQNPDGSYSTNYLHRTGWTRDLGESLGTTGHVLEFLAFAAPDATLQEPWVGRSVRRICQMLDDCQGIDLECGVLYHALHGLSEYEQRMKQIRGAAPADIPANDGGGNPDSP